jgi:hypothetical protein
MPAPPPTTNAPEFVPVELVVFVMLIVPVVLIDVAVTTDVEMIQANPFHT